MRVSEGYYFGCVPILVVAPRLIALYAHTVMNCYATTDYENYRDFSFCVNRYVVFRLSPASNQIILNTEDDTTTFEAGICIPEIKTLHSLFKEILKVEIEIGSCAKCGKRIGWKNPDYTEIMSRTVISTPGTNRRILSSYCFDCLSKKQFKG